MPVRGRVRIAGEWALLIACGIAAVPVGQQVARIALDRPQGVTHWWPLAILLAGLWSRWRFGAVTWGVIAWAVGYGILVLLDRGHEHLVAPGEGAARLLATVGATVAGMAGWAHAVAERGAGSRLAVRWALAPIVAAGATMMTELHLAAPVILLTLAVQLTCARLLVRAAGRRPVAGLTLANTLCGYGMFALSCVLMPPFSLVVLLAGNHRSRLLRAGMRWWMRLVYVVTPTVRWSWSGDPASLAGRRIVVSNHESILDILSACALPGTRNLLAKTWVFRAPFLGLAARFAGVRNSDRLERADDEESAAITDPSMIASEGLYIFPEGRRTRDGRIQRFRLGAFALADTAEAEVVPVALAGSGWSIPAGQSWIHPGDVVSEILPPMRRAPFETLRAFAARTRATVAAARFARMRQLIVGEQARRHRAGWFTGLPAALRRQVRREERSGAWRAVVEAVADTDDDWLLLGCGWSSDVVCLRLMVRPVRMIAVEPDPRRRAVARHAWFHPGQDVLSADPVAAPAGRLSLVVHAAFAEAIAMIAPGGLTTSEVRAAVVPVADTGAWLAALPGLRSVRETSGMAVLSAATP
ncbi:MAG: 1-acyl-sn-glycerol-3-phosphate acyltransferase [Planctomycetes bacterium]|nr:1-acyl-sn-glycerol-3-phosphate acyltransferase [Planctomycetota bacterium]